MRILDRYATKQLMPVWLWCVLVFVFVSCIVDLFGRLDEILRYHIPASTVLQYYLNFIPLVFVWSSPLALLFSSAFVGMRLVRHQELLAMNASGTSLLRASIPFVFVGWLVSGLVFIVNERVVPTTSAVYERLRQEAFGGQQQRKQVLENVATMDSENRLYLARLFDFKTQELSDLTVLEHDVYNRPKKTIYARRAVPTPHGWLLLYGTVTRLTTSGTLKSEPEPFVERLVEFPVTPESFRQADTQPETMRYGQLRQLISRLKEMGVTNVRRYAVDLAAKVTLPLMNALVCLIGFVGSTRQYGRGRLRGLGTSLAWGVLYYIVVAMSQGMGKRGLLPVVVSVWAPHLLALVLCWRATKQHG